MKGISDKNILMEAIKMRLKNKLKEEPFEIVDGFAFDCNNNGTLEAAEEIIAECRRECPNGMNYSVEAKYKDGILIITF